MVTNDSATPGPAAPEDLITGAGATYLRVLSDADLALCALLVDQVNLSGEKELSLVEVPRQPAPQALLATLMTAVAGRLAGVSTLTPVLSVSLRFIEQAYTDEELRFVALDVTPDAAGALVVRLRVESADGRPLAEGVIHFSVN